jgi:hypothetical protein
METASLTKALTTSDEPSAVPKEMEGLGYGIELDAEDQINVEPIEMDRGEGSSSSSTNIILGQVQPEVQETAAPAEAEATEERDIEFPSTEVMQGMSDKLAKEGMEHAELVEMVSILSLEPIDPSSHPQAKSLLVPCLESLPLLRDQLEAQRATIRTMQEQARLASKLSEIERYVIASLESRA